MSVSEAGRDGVNGTEEFLQVRRRYGCERTRGLDHGAHCVQGRVKAHGLGLCRLQVRIVHGILERCLPIAVLMPGIAVVLHFGS